MLNGGLVIDDLESKHDLGETFKEYMTSAEEMVKNEKDIENWGCLLYSAYLRKSKSVIKNMHPISLNNQQSKN